MAARVKNILVRVSSGVGAALRSASDSGLRLLRNPAAIPNPTPIAVAPPSIDSTSRAVDSGEKSLMTMNANAGTSEAVMNGIDLSDLGNRCQGV
jgi:hypothetical protein